MVSMPSGKNVRIDPVKIVALPLTSRNPVVDIRPGPGSRVDAVKTRSLFVARVRTVPCESVEITTLATATVGPAVEFPAGTLAFDGSLDVTDTQIIWTATLAETYGTGAFNGFELVFSGAPTITGVSLDSGSTLTPVSFSTAGGNEIFLNLAGLTALAGQKTILDVTTSSSPAPEPTTFVLLATGLFGVAWATAKRKARS
jgi:hypothetical protein